MRLILFWLTAFLLYMGVASAQTSYDFSCDVDITEGWEANEQGNVWSNTDFGSATIEMDVINFGGILIDTYYILCPNAGELRAIVTPYDDPDTEENETLIYALEVLNKEWENDELNNGSWKSRCEGD